MDQSLNGTTEAATGHSEKDVLQFLLETQFGELPEWATAKLDTGSPEDMERWVLNLFTENELEAVLQ